MPFLAGGRRHVRDAYACERYRVGEVCSWHLANVRGPLMISAFEAKRPRWWPRARKSLGSRTQRRKAGIEAGTLLRQVQIALKPASKTLEPRGVFIRSKDFKYLIADSAFKRMQVDAPGACWLDADEHHRGLALRTGGALNCSEWDDGRQALRSGHDASLEQAGAQHSLSPVMTRRRSGD
jgi:hypothetical protein